MSEDAVGESRPHVEGGVSATATAAGEPDIVQSRGEHADGVGDAPADAGASPKQRAANKANARRSTGPRTASGKARSGLNAVQHGLQGRFRLIAGEDPGQFGEFRNRLHGQLTPDGAMEEELAERVISAFWRLRRIGRMESEMIDKILEDAVRDKNDHVYRSTQIPVDAIFGTPLASPEWDLNAITVGEAVMRQMPNGDVIGNLHRYEAHLERGLYKALHELQRLQAVRHGQDVPAPAALDITTDLAREREPGSQAK